MDLDDDDEGGVEFSLDTLPDNDSFLPRYLTIQLLEILAHTINQGKILEDSARVIRNKSFVDSFKSQELFTPLTYSIFWRENIEKTLADAQSIDEVDKYNRAPLTLAIANEDFELALQLIQAGAALLLEDKLVLEIALIAMIQRNPSFIQEVTNAPGNYDITWLKEYLAYLNGYITGTPQKTALRYHEVLNPPLRHFGQVLDTLAYFNGLPSHYGFISPSIEILSAHLKHYLQELGNNEFKNIFAAIADAYDTTRQVCNYYGNLPVTADAARILTSRITSNIQNNNHNVVVLFGGFAGNSVAIAFIDKTLVLSNLGVGGNPKAGTRIYSVAHPDKITETMVNTFIRGLGNATAPSEILDLIGDIVDPAPLITIKQTFNPIDNCIFVNPRAVIQGVLLALTAYHKDNKITAQNLAQFEPITTQAFASYVDSLYKYSSQDLAKSMRNKELIQNKRIECCALALDYINQHFTEQDALERCIELKNALEFVGLKDFYASSIEPEARAAIQQRIIYQQEAAAMKVIEQENNLIAAGHKK